MKAIYQPKGKAKEYADLAVNLYTGCPHRCQYPCFAPKILHKSPEEFHSKVEPREGIIGKIEADCAELAKRRSAGETIPPILLCFVCDPYPIGYDTSTTRAAIMMIKAHGLNFTILTKGAEAFRDFDLYGPDVHPWRGRRLRLKNDSFFQKREFFVHFSYTFLHKKEEKKCQK